MMAVIREVLATIAACAVAGPPAPLRPIRGERPAAGPLASANVAVEAEPFIVLSAELAVYFGGDPAVALAGPDADEAGRHATRIVAEHLATARIRLAEPPPTLDWSDRDSLMAASVAAARRAADLRFVEILAEVVPA
jgi:hypothetical protein